MTLDDPSKSLFFIQIAASQAAGSSFNQPARTMMTLSVNAYVDVANTLREVYILDPSQRENGFTAERKGDVLRQLRKQFENARKMFTFSIANASKYLHLSLYNLLIILSRSRTGSGIAFGI